MTLFKSYNDSEYLQNIISFIEEYPFDSINTENDAYKTAYLICIRTIRNYEKNKNDYFNKNSNDFLAASIWVLKTINEEKYCNFLYLLQFCSLDIELIISTFDKLDSNVFISNMRCSIPPLHKILPDTIEETTAHALLCTSRINLTTIKNVLKSNISWKTKFEIIENDLDFIEDLKKN